MGSSKLISRARPTPSAAGSLGKLEKVVICVAFFVVGMNRQATDADRRRVRERELSGGPAISAEIDARSLITA